MPSIGSSAPLHLLQDLARRQADAEDLEISLPSPTELADLAPLSLPLPVLLRYGIISIDSLNNSVRAHVETQLSGSFDPTSTSRMGNTSVTAITLSNDELDDLSKLSIEASTHMRQEYRACENATDAWKTRLSHQDVWRVCAVLEERMVNQGQGFMLVPS